MTTIDVVLLVLLLATALVGAFSDVRHRRIPDWLTYPALAIAVGLHAIGSGFGSLFESGVISSVFGAGFCAVVFGVFWLWKKGFGGGDVKLMAALGAMTGFVNSLTLAMATALIGALLALGRIVLGPEALGVWKRREPEAEAAARATPGPGRKRTMTVPYGVAIALGTIWTVLIQHNLLPGL